MPSSPPDAHALGRAVRAIREERGLSQVRVAEVPVHYQSVSWVCRGSQRLDIGWPTPELYGK